ncbi:retroviral-like aspartic protease family protein [Nitrospirillum sp. BR 11752]|uniref:retroviral-like aspartic protease family protein n=1 Tax=Nitrospirillum sp. BR 11752 TaxID=3104293 RepID=UPI002E9E65C5|nr:retroviral-like aspartic protease family protein [Nitrospirillum sp. BR 11752]
MPGRVAGVIVGMLLALPGAAAESSKCQLLSVGTLDLVMDGNAPLVPVEVNAQKVYLLMDTGAAMGMLTTPAAARLNLTHHWVPNLYVDGVGGRVSVDVARIKDFSLGLWTTHNLDFPVAGNHDIGPPNVVGLLGESFLSRFDLDLDIAHSRVKLFKPKDCDDVVLAYWGGAYNEADIGRSSETNPKIWLTVKVNGTELRAALDTGAYTSVMTERAAEKAGVTKDSPGVTRSGTSHGIGNDAVDDYIGVFDSFELGDEQIRHVRLRFGELFSHGGREIPEMLLGLDFLRAHRMFVAHSQRKVYFSYVGGPIFQVTGPRLRRVAPQPAPLADDASPAAPSATVTDTDKHP